MARLCIQASHGTARAKELKEEAGLDLKALLPPHLEQEDEKSQEVRSHSSQLETFI